MLCMSRYNHICINYFKITKHHYLVTTNDEVVDICVTQQRPQNRVSDIYTCDAKYHKQCIDNDSPIYQSNIALDYLLSGFCTFDRFLLHTKCTIGYDGVVWSTFIVQLLHGFGYVPYRGFFTRVQGLTQPHPGGPHIPKSPPPPTTP